MRRRNTKILILPGDGIGKEITEEAKKIIDAVTQTKRMDIDIEMGLIGGAAIEITGKPVTDETIKKAKSSDAILLGAVGGPQWDSLDYSIRPEHGLLRMRKELRLFANLRPVRIFTPLIDASPLKKELVEGTDFIVVRELTGGIYFGKPRGIKKTSRGEKGLNTEVYYRNEVERIARFAFEIAKMRKKRVTSVDKANVLESSLLWRNVVTEIHKEYPDIELNHLYVDNCAMQIIRNPQQFDVILTNNMFGDILSDEAAMVAGSIGLLPSASLGGGVGLYEPIHGSAPDIAGQNKANPLATILSVALMFRYSFGNMDIARAIEKAIENVLEQGYRTPDIADKNSKIYSTKEMGDSVKQEFERMLVHLMT